MYTRKHPIVASGGFRGGQGGHGPRPRAFHSKKGPRTFHKMEKSSSAYYAVLFVLVLSGFCITVYYVEILFLL